MQATVPTKQIMIHTNKVGVQLFVASASAANPLVAAAAPIYVQELSRPDIVDTLPYLAKLLGTMAISIRLTPCIHPTITAIRSMDTSTELVNTFTKYKAVALTSAIPKITPPQSTSFVISLR